jgi:hypothetical protein
MRDAMLALLLALANGAQPSSAPNGIASGPAYPSAMVSSVGAAVGGAWAGEWAEAGAGAPIGLEAAFRTGATAKTVFGYFTFIEHGVRRTVLRQGVSAVDGLRFMWPGGRQLKLRLTGSDRLEGEMVATPAPGGAQVHAGAVSLSRRPR